MKLGIIIPRSDPESVYDTLRLAVYALKYGDEAKVFLSGAGVEIDRIKTHGSCPTTGPGSLELRRTLLACGSCLKLRESQGSDTCPLSSMSDEYEIIRESDKVLSV